MAVVNTLTFNDTATVMGVKSFIAHALGSVFTKLSKCVPGAWTTKVFTVVIYGFL
jgi:hypothetical protein